LMLFYRLRNSFDVALMFAEKCFKPGHNLMF
jgi:hypothetical protein